MYVSRNSSTSYAECMAMPVTRFWESWLALCSVIDDHNRAMDEARQAAGGDR